MKYFNKTFIHFFLIVIAVFGLYWQTSDFDFVLDDTMVITENNFVKNGINGISDIFNNDSMTGYLGKQPNLLAGGRYRPLSLAVFATGHEIFGLNAKYFHLINLFFYALCSIILYLTLLHLFKSLKENTPNIRLYSFIAVLLFTVHPIHTEAVANIKGLDEILAFLFGIIAFLFTLIYLDKRKIIFIIIGLIAFILSLLAKESTLPLLLAIPVSVYFFRETSLKRVFHLFLLFLIPTLLYLIIRYNVMGFLLNNDVNVTGIMNNPYIDSTPGQKFGTIIFTLLLYIKLLFFPHPLTHDYYPYHIKLIEFYNPLSVLALLIILFLIIYAVKGIKSRNKLSYIIFFFFITISIVSNVVINVGAFMNERFLFIPSFTFALLILFGFEKLNRHKIYSTTFWIGLFLLFSGFVYKSSVRIPDWKNEKTLNKAAVQISENSARSNCFYAVSIYNTILNGENKETKTEQISEAKKHIEKSLSIYPEYADALRMKAGLAAEIYKMDKNAGKLLKEFEDILTVRHIKYVDEFSDWLNPRADKQLMADFYFNAGYKIFAVQHKNFNLALNYLQKGIKINPNHEGILFGSCVVYYLSGNYQKTIETGNAFIQNSGINAEILYYLGNAQIKNGQQQLGLNNLGKAYQMNPELRNRK